jgi:hypothetical protein
MNVYVVDACVGIKWYLPEIHNLRLYACIIQLINCKKKTTLDRGYSINWGVI